MRSKRRYRFILRIFINNVVCPVISAIGLLVVLGTAGASDADAIGMFQFFIQIGLGIALMACPFLLAKKSVKGGEKIDD